MQLNSQPIEKRIDRTDGSVEVHSVFHTIQGEGPFCGTPCVFVRLAGCNLQCPMCDTEYSAQRELMAPGAIVSRVQALQPRRGLVVITGGEPFRQRLAPLFNALVDAGYYVQVETNGTLPPPDGVLYSVEPSKRKGVYVVCSPKTGKVNKVIWDVACCAKYVLCSGDAAEDGLPVTALGHSANPHLARPPVWFNGLIYLQPADEKDEFINLANIAEVRDSCMKHGYILQLQIHKLIGVE